MTAAKDPKLAVIVSFLDEAEYMPTLLASIEAQTQPPDQLLLVDDGSTDGSPQIAFEFAARHPWVSVMPRPPRPARRDRLEEAAELRAFQWGVEHLTSPWDIVVKMDADLRLSPELFEMVRDRFAADPQLGLTGSYLSVIGPDGKLRRERHPEHHVRGPNKFYRRECYLQIAPLPPILGWDMIDDLRARMNGWRTQSFALSSGDSIHLRPTGQHDGRLRAFRRWGRCAWGYGAHPAWVMLGGLYRARQRPFLLGGLSYIWGWAAAGAHRYQRADRPVREFVRREELAEMRKLLLSLCGDRKSTQ